MTDTVGQQLIDALDEIDQLRGSKAALQVEIDRLRALNDEQQTENERLQAHATSMINEMKAERDKKWTEHLIEREDLKAEVKRWKDAEERADRCITDLRAIVAGTERRECEYLALIEKHATEVERLRAERHTTKQMLEDILYKHESPRPPHKETTGGS